MSTPPPGPRIAFTVVVPTYASSTSRLGECLAALAALDYPPDELEVLVVDDGSPAPPDPLVQSWKAKVPVRLLTIRHGGPSAARNAGAREARGRWLAFTDDDCAPEAGWLRALEGRLAADPRTAVGGLTLNDLPENRFSAASQLLIHYLYDHFNGPGGVRFLTSNNLAVWTETFRGSGGFDETFHRTAAEDREFCDRWVHLGHRLAFAADAVVRHRHELTLRRFWRQHLHYGRGAFVFHGVRARRAGRFRLEPPSFYARLLLRPWSDGLPAPIRTAALLALSQLANAAGFAVEAATELGERRRPRRA
ncbi:MAG TPA: glycosyltransferase [Gemmatimonadota bacterium]|jgi:glycosyltransferase involved in cell wall biosynthesis